MEDAYPEEPIDQSTFLSYFLTLGKTAQEEHVTRANRERYPWYYNNLHSTLVTKHPMIIPTMPIACGNIELGLNEEALANALSDVAKIAQMDKRYTAHSNNVGTYYLFNTIGSIPLLWAIINIRTRSSWTKKPSYFFRFFMKKPNIFVKRINRAMGNALFPISFLIPYSVFTLFNSLFTDLQKSPSQSHVNGPKAILYYILLDVAQNYAQDILRGIKKTVRRRRQTARLEGTSNTANIQKLDMPQHNSYPTQAKTNVAQKKNNSKMTIGKLLTLLSNRAIKLILAMRLATRYETY